MIKLISFFIPSKIVFTLNLFVLGLIVSGIYAQEITSLSDSTKLLSASDLYKIGLEYARNRNFKTAIDFYNLSLQKDSTLVDAVFRRGLANDNLGHTHEAIEDYSKAIEIEPRAIFYNNRAIDKAIFGFFEEAINDYNEALRLRPDYGDALINRGYAFAELNRMADACRDFRKAKEIGHLMAPEMLEAFCE